MGAFAHRPWVNLLLPLGKNAQRLGQSWAIRGMTFPDSINAAKNNMQCWGAFLYNILRCNVEFIKIKCLILLKYATFFLKYLAVSENSSTFALAFEKYGFSKQLKKEFFERFYINRQVVQEAVNFLEIRKLTG